MELGPRALPLAPLAIENWRAVPDSVVETTSWEGRLPAPSVILAFGPEVLPELVPVLDDPSRYARRSAALAILELAPEGFDPAVLQRAAVLAEGG